MPIVGVTSMGRGLGRYSMSKAVGHVWPTTSEWGATKESLAS